MSNTVITPAGADWLAKSICATSTDKCFMCVLYSNNNGVTVDLSDCVGKSFLKNLPSDLGYIKTDSNISISTKSTDSDQYAGNCVVFSTIIKSTASGVGPELTSGTSKIIAVLAGYKDSSGDDVIITAGGVGEDGAYSPVQWVSGLSLAVSCPIAFSSNVSNGDL